MLSFLLLIFLVLLLLWFLCCYVVKLGKAKKKTKKNTPKKWKYFRVFFTRQAMVACAQIIVFWGGCFVVFFLVAQKHYKNSFFLNFDMLIFSFLGQNFKVNNLATSRPITWPHFWQTF